MMSLDLRCRLEQFQCIAVPRALWLQPAVFRCLLLVVAVEAWMIQFNNIFNRTKIATAIDRLVSLVSNVCSAFVVRHRPSNSFVRLTARHSLHTETRLNIIRCLCCKLQIVSARSAFRVLIRSKKCESEPNQHPRLVKPNKTATTR